MTSGEDCELTTTHNMHLPETCGFSWMRAVERLQLLEHAFPCNSNNIFVRCERDHICVSKAVLSLAETLVRHKDSDLMVPEDIMSTAKTLLDALNGIVAKEMSRCEGCFEKASICVDVSKAHSEHNVNVLQG